MAQVVVVVVVTMSSDATDRNTSEGANNGSPCTGSTALEQIQHHVRDYVRRGWSPIPVPLGRKKPVITEWQKLQITAEQIPEYFPEVSNVGILLGKASGGLTDIDLDCEEAVAHAMAFLPPTRCKFGRPSRPASHLLYIADEDVGVRKYSFGDNPRENCLLEIRGSGHQTIFPPSIHKDSGEEIRFDEDGDPARVSLQELMKACGKLAAAVVLARSWWSGSRHDAALALSGWLLRNGWSADDVEELLEVVCDMAGDDEREDRLRAVRDTAKQIERGMTVTGLPTLAEIMGPDVPKKIAQWLSTEPHVVSHHLTDAGNARRLAARHGQDLRYCDQLGGWLIWDARRWARDETFQVVARAKDTVQSIYAEAARELDEERRKAIGAHAKRSESERCITAMVKLTRSEPGIALTSQAFDPDPMLINCLNGTLRAEGREIKFRDHKRDDLITKIIPVAYRPEAQCPRWLQALDEIFAGNQELIQFIQKAAGYTLTGNTDEQCLFILYGGGENGKSTFVEVLRGLLGDYGTTADIETFLAGKGNSIRNDIARLKGSRLVSSIEADEGRRLSEALIKNLTGGDRVSARYLYHEFFEFSPTFKLWFAVNHKPGILGTDNAIWRRIRLVPFTVVIPKEKRERDLAKRLKAEELEGILAWAVEGLKLWLQEGLEPPQLVKDATVEYRAEMDTVARVPGRSLRDI